MFQPETEDMLPRMAPKPNTMNEAIAIPQVPEISILYGQDKMVEKQLQPQKIENSEKQPQSYANWRKQMLPRVTFSATLEHEQKQPEQLHLSKDYTLSVPAANLSDFDNNNGRSTIYPFRIMPSTEPNVHLGTMAIASGGTFNYNSISTHPIRNCDIVNYSGAIYKQQIQQQEQEQQQQQNLQKLNQNYLETTPPSTASHGACSNNRDVLTICAGSQTDSPSIHYQQQNVVCKQDMEHLMAIIQDMRQEQKRILQLCEAFLMNQTFLEKKPTCKDASIQVKINYGDDNADMQDLIIPQIVPFNTLIPNLNLNVNGVHQRTPNIKPIAQSSAYQMNTPQIAATDIDNNNIGIILPKPTTEKSLIMNELAFKYLATDKLTELFHDLNLKAYNAANMNTNGNNNDNNIEEQHQHHHQQQHQVIDNMEKTPNEVSNSSYKYLKKYRLLPEDYAHGDAREKLQKNNAEDQSSHNERNVRSSPGLQKPEHMSSSKKYPLPYHLGLSAGAAVKTPSSPTTPPLGISSNPRAISAGCEQMLDFENIKQQPKFL